MSRESDFRSWLESDEFKSSNREFFHGNAAPFKALWSHRDDVTLVGAFGSILIGWDAVGEALDFTAAQFISGATEFDYQAVVVGEDVAYTVAYDRTNAHMVNRPGPAPMVLRVTNCYRLEDGHWKVTNRHADAVTAFTPDTASVLQQ